VLPLLGRMTLSNHLLSLVPTDEVVCAYAAPVAQLMADTTGRWVAIGGFQVPTGIRCRLAVQGFRTPGVTVSVAIFGPTLLAASVVGIASDSDAEARSGVVDLAAGVQYLLAYRVVGAASEYNYAVIRTAGLAPE
jgi:hypothetical protein